MMSICILQMAMWLFLCCFGLSDIVNWDLSLAVFSLELGAFVPNTESFVNCIN